jgi:hypothetical protein
LVFLDPFITSIGIPLLLLTLFQLNRRRKKENCVEFEF